MFTRKRSRGDAAHYITNIRGLWNFKDDWFPGELGTSTVSQEGYWRLYRISKANL